MRNLIYIFLILFIVTSCDHNKIDESEKSITDKATVDSLVIDSIFNFAYITNFSHLNITNNSDRQIDLLFNSIDKYLGGQTNPLVHFQTECMRCQPIQEYKSGLLFAKQLLITKSQIQYFTKGFDIPDSLHRIEFNSDHGERTNSKFKFSDGDGSIKYIGVSCNDADFNKVLLSYSTGKIIIDSLINASFFEYDLNADGQKEQYLIGTRNCSQELIILRIRKLSDIK